MQRLQRETEGMRWNGDPLLNVESLSLFFLSPLSLLRLISFLLNRESTNKNKNHSSHLLFSKPINMENEERSSTKKVTGDERGDEMNEPTWYSQQ